MDLANITVDEYTTPSPFFVSSTSKLPEVWQMMQDKKIRHVLVQDGSENIVGIVSERDLTMFSQSNDFSDIEAKDIMSTKLLTVTPETKLYEVALAMSKNKYGSTLIQSEDSTYTGIFTATDALNALVEILRGDI